MLKPEKQISEPICLNFIFTRSTLGRHATNNLIDVTGNGGKLEWVNDGFCDDMNNNEACNYDGGDCCGVYSNKRFCLKCECISKSCE